ncbi:MAG TPA: hypothetical protein VNM47_02265 [Terriglobia bacterium]|nr:hypothetical protein [Terriglobia bacterium]
MDETLEPVEDANRVAARAPVRAGAMPAAFGRLRQLGWYRSYGSYDIRVRVFFFVLYELGSWSG